MPKPPTRAEILDLAARAQCDPRTAARELAAQRGETDIEGNPLKPVRGLTGDRIRAAIKAKRAKKKVVPDA